MWHFMTRTDLPSTLLLWLKHGMRKDYEHLHTSVHTWHSSIKHFSTITVLISLTFQMHFFPFLLKWRHSYSILAKHIHNSQSSRRHCFLKALFQISSTQWGNQSNLCRRRTYFHCFCHLSARTVLFGWVWRRKKTAWAMKEEKLPFCKRIDGFWRLQNFFFQTN